MYLKSLTLRGFKSFASATTLNFEPGITCVVGPNGSGKSNVVDALAWVMGEQGAKSLRGGKMDDVIFAGTAGRAPLGRAEVVLTIDNSDGALPIDFAEVTISRTLFRSGGSEYAINGHSARLLDVQELLSDSGIGREMHVIVGQGQLDSILQATPESRRGFIEEAAGVLKHRKRKEKALRKLEATEANLNRLADLLTEIRRQLKPLARQADVARKAAVIQAELRDAKARLLADDLIQATLELETELADEAALKQRRHHIETSLAAAREAEEEAESALREIGPRLGQAQETWYGLSALKERVATTIQIAADRMRYADDQPDVARPARDPEALEREAAEIGALEAELRREIEQKAAELDEVAKQRSHVEAEHAAEDRRLAAQIRAAADRREGLARLTGQVNSLRSRAEAAQEQIERLEKNHAEALQRAETARQEFTRLETTVAGVEEGESGLDAAYEAAEEKERATELALTSAREAVRRAQTERASLAARLEGLHVGMKRKDAGAALLTATDRLGGLLGSVAALLRVENGYETAVSAALGSAADAVAVTNVDAALGAFSLLKKEDLGRAGLLLGGGPDLDREAWPTLPKAARYAVDVITCEDTLRPALERVLRKVALVEDLEAAKELVTQLPDVEAVTREGDVLSAWFASGGSSAQPSLIEVQAAIDEVEAKLRSADAEVERLTFEVAGAERKHAEATEEVQVALARLHESDAQMAAIAEELGQLNSAARSAESEAQRLAKAMAEAQATRERDLAGLEELQARLDLACVETDEVDPDSTERDRLAEQARHLRAKEMDARLSLRTLEERARGMAGRADSLCKQAESERAAHARAVARAEQLRREAEIARAVHAGAQQIAVHVEVARTQAQAIREGVEAERRRADMALGNARQESRRLAKELEELVDSVHRDEMVRTQQRMRIEALGEKGLNELGLSAEVLMAEYGPEHQIPVLAKEDGTAFADDEERPEPVPFVREEQARRLRNAERQLGILGRVNPLALEEFDAMQERHAFLATQLEDIKKTRRDLSDIIADVDKHVEAVFAAAYADVEAAFERVFARLFPGGEGRLVLTDPGQWLTTGVEVEARPAGKKVKRLSLLSGGERSLVAVAFLVALFIARPSPFYILDEVEAALDDTNLGRLLDIYQELRENSQLLVITHQKRTMEIADALYGVTMRGDGVSTVISQRLSNN